MTEGWARATLGRVLSLTIHLTCFITGLTTLPVATDMPLRGLLARLNHYRLPSNVHALPVASSTDTMTIVLTLLRNSYGTAWHGAESTELRDTLCSSGFSLIATRPALIQHLFISFPLGGPANLSCA